MNSLVESQKSRRLPHSSGSTTPTVIRVLIADSDPNFRNRCKSILSYYPEFHLVGECSNGSEVQMAFEASYPHVVVMDLYLPRMDGVEVTYHLNSMTPQTKVLILSDQADPYVLESIRNGASGYLLKSAEPHQLLEAMRVVAYGGYYIHPIMVSRIVGELRRLSKIEGAFGRIHTSYQPTTWQEILTRREMEVLRLLSQGKNNRMIGEHLFISEKTVKNHVSKILYKLHVQDRTQAVLLAIKYGWVQLI